MGIAGQKPISLWIEQMQTLVDGRPAILCDHLGVVFLFGNTGIDVSYPPRAPLTDEHRGSVLDKELRRNSNTLDLLMQSSNGSNGSPFTSSD